MTLQSPNGMVTVKGTGTEYMKCPRTPGRVVELDDDDDDHELVRRTFGFLTGLTWI